MENASKALIIAGAILIAILLISIGIILINSGKDVTSTGTQGMQSQKIQTFNSQFTPYEGTKKGAEIKSLISVVEASNATDSEHQVALRGLTSTFDTNISDSKTYTVTLYYSDGGAVSACGAKHIAGILKKSDKGYINQIVISE